MPKCTEIKGMYKKRATWVLLRLTLSSIIQCQRLCSSDKTDQVLLFLSTFNTYFNQEEQLLWFVYFYVQQRWFHVVPMKCVSALSRTGVRACLLMKQVCASCRPYSLIYINRSEPR